MGMRGEEPSPELVLSERQSARLREGKSFEIPAVTGHIAISYVSLPFHQNCWELTIFMQQCKNPHYHPLNMHE